MQRARFSVTHSLTNPIEAQMKLRHQLRRFLACFQRAGLVDCSSPMASTSASNGKGLAGLRSDKSVEGGSNFYGIVKGLSAHVAGACSSRSTRRCH